ncbi:hypothetical protein SLEP1_g12374 [Rubroshorea leprosula]|uniref:EF-hand domain-containing protein n=1 Tax=Rubroshorea leprosula TaxID=152421 RepID=A0AAV5IM40_9ROSI|nr:hypothetical protein SLEP1_g12374 [Rubroshorea leprosula]
MDVNSSSLVEVERDYLSIDKRYPRLIVSPHFTKVVVNWPKENLNLSLHTPVSFEHNFIEEDGLPEVKALCSNLFPEETVKSEHKSTVWNAKIVLMSGLSKSAVEELSSEKFADDRIPHICNILRFAVLKRDHSFLAIGGQWNAVDGGNPYDDDSSLIRTALRYAKDVTNLDLQSCQNWNRFLEIHYDRVGKDGLFSHKEVTVLFVPDLSECLPSLDLWRAQWLAHKKALADRERQLSLKRERSREKKEGSKDKGIDSSKELDRGKSELSTLSGQGTAVDKEEKGGNCIEGDAIVGKGGGSDNKIEIKDGNKNDAGVQGSEKGEQGEGSITQSTGSKKRPVKKKIVKRIVKQKVANKIVDAVNAASKQNDKMDEDVGEQNALSEISGQQEEPSDHAVDVTKSVVEKEAVGDEISRSEDNSRPPEMKAEMESSENKPKDSSDPSSSVAAKKVGGKTTIKKKIIKRVPKRKVTATQASDGVDTNKDGDKDEVKVGQDGNETENKGKQTVLEKQASAADSSKLESKAEKTEKVAAVELVADKQSGKSKGSIKSKDEKVKVIDRKDESRSNSNKELKEKKKSEELPRHPGLILQMKGSKESKLQSLSLSLESLLDYTDKDIEESTFELSLFAETLYEMLQYQMGCHLLTFLQKLRLRFVTKRNQQKRQREESEKGNENLSPAKHLRTSELPVKNESTKSETPPAAQKNDEQTRAKEETTVDHVNEAKTKDEADDEPEEDPEEYEVEDESPQDNSCNENKEGKTDVDPEPERLNGNEKYEESIEDKVTTKVAEKEPQPDGDASAKIGPVINTGKKEESVDKESVDKELLQAFRFFDRNRVGYIRVEDLRLIIHNLGKFLSHKDVKELVQSALLESNTGRDDRILYNKLVRMSHI